MELHKAREKFKSHLSEKAGSKNTAIAYNIDVDQLIKFLSSIDILKIATVEIAHLEKFINSLTQTNYTTKTISRKINSIKTFFRFLNDQGYVSENPSKALQHQKFDSKAPRILTKLEYRSLRDASKEDSRTLSMIEILLQTGIRISELSEIKIKDLSIDSSKPALHIPRQNSIPARDIPLNKTAVNAVKSYLDERPKVESEYLFITKSGNPILVRNIRSSIDKFLKVIGLEDVKVNDLRHTFIAFHLQNGVDLLYLSKIAGHKRVSTTEKYLNYIEKPKDLDKSDLSSL
jgi:site-specific recombinase XerD